MIDALSRLELNAWRPPVPHTVAMDRRLDTLEESTRVVGVHDGLPVLRVVSGRRYVLTTLGHLERA